MGPRTRLAWGFTISAIVLVVMLLATPVEHWNTHRVLGFSIKLTVVIGLLWLAWPDLTRIGKKLPPRFIILAAISLLTVLINARFGAFLVALTMVYFAGWWLYQRLFKKP